MSELSKTERIRRQTDDEWRADYDKAGGNNSLSPQCIIKPKIRILNTETGRVPEDIRKAGITHVRYVGERLLITLDRPISDELDNRIKQGIQKLVKIAEPDTGQPLYLYTGYRTIFINKRSFLAVTFREIHTGSISERYFNIELRNKKGKSFKTGDNGEFRVVGNIKRLQEGMFLKFWMDAVKQLPDGRPAHIYRYMNARLSGVVVSCSNPLPHHGFIKLTKLKYEGHLYEIT